MHWSGVETLTERAGYRKDVDDLARRQMEKTFPSARWDVCPYDGGSCQALKSWACMAPVYQGEGHDIIVAWFPCPRGKT
jgi:hypothetical protein